MIVLEVNTIVETGFFLQKLNNGIVINYSTTDKQTKDTVILRDWILVRFFFASVLIV